MVPRSLVVREQQLTGLPPIVELHGQALQPRIHPVADLTLDQLDGHRLHAATADYEAGLDAAETESDEEHRNELAAVAAADRPVHDRFEHERDQACWRRPRRSRRRA